MLFFFIYIKINGTGKGNNTYVNHRAYNLKTLGGFLLHSQSTLCGPDLLGRDITTLLIWESIVKYQDPDIFSGRLLPGFSRSVCLTTIYDFPLMVYLCYLSISYFFHELISYDQNSVMDQLPDLTGKFELNNQQKWNEWTLEVWVWFLMLSVTVFMLLL